MRKHLKQSYEQALVVSPGKTFSLSSSEILSMKIFAFLPMAPMLYNCWLFGETDFKIYRCVKVSSVWLIVSKKRSMPF